MDWLGTTLKILEHGLGIIGTKQARKYLDEVIKLKEIYHEEYNKPKNFRNNAVMDNVDSRLRIIAESFTQLGKSKS